MACPSSALSTEPTLTRFVYYKVVTLVPVSAALVAITRHSGSLLWQEKVLLLIYALGIVGLVMSIGLNACSRCLNFDCGHCGVPEEIRKEHRETIGIDA